MWFTLWLFWEIFSTLFDIYQIKFDGKQSHKSKNKEFLDRPEQIIQFGQSDWSEF